MAKEIGVIMVESPTKIELQNNFWMVVGGGRRYIFITFVINY